MEERQESIDCIVSYIHDIRDRNSFSLVSRKFYDADGNTRKHVTVHICYATTPFRLHQRFPFLESITLLGSPILPSRLEASSWLREITDSFNLLKVIRLQHLHVIDSDLIHLAQTRGKQLRILEISFCSGFSTHGLLHISKYCNDLRSLSLQESSVLDLSSLSAQENDGIWLHELALHNTRIESLNFHNAHLDSIDVKDLTLIAKNCSESLVSVKLSERCDFIDLVDFLKYAVNLEDFGIAKNCSESLVSVKLSERCDFIDLVDFLKYAVNLEDFGGGSFSSVPFGATQDKYSGLEFPPKIQYLALKCTSQMYGAWPFAHLITELDLTYTASGRVRYHRIDHTLVERCPNLEALYTSDSIGDKGLKRIGKYCKKLRKLYINQAIHVRGLVSHIGLIDLAQRCHELECLHINLGDVTNEALAYIGMHLKNLHDLSLNLLNQDGRMTHLPLDNGVRDLLIGCTKLERLDICFGWNGGLTDIGLGYIGKYGHNLRYLSLCYTGESDAGLVELSNGCLKLRELVIRKCPFTKDALDIFLCRASTLRYFSVPGINRHYHKIYLEQTCF